MRIKLYKQIARWGVTGAILLSIVAMLWLTRSIWVPQFTATRIVDSADIDPPVTPEDVQVLKLSEQARRNLQLRVSAVAPQAYWKTIEIPGVVVDRPGVTDTGITSPLAGVITTMHALEGDIVQAGQKLFSIRLISDYLQRAQLDLFKAVREIELLNTEINRLRPLADTGAVPGVRLIELEQQIKRQKSLIEGQRQDLLSRGLSEMHLVQIESGEFLTTIDIRVPESKTAHSDLRQVSMGTRPNQLIESVFLEVQSVKVSLGQQVDAGQLLAVLANHRALYVKGSAFKKESFNLSRAAEEGWPLRIDFTEDTSSGWPEVHQEFRVRHLANNSDPASRTFDFFVPLTNQYRMYEKEGRTFVLWRYRPGQRVRISVPVEELRDVIVLPTAAVAFEGPEAFVFQQNGDLFHRISVRVLHQDRTHVVIANDGAILPGFHLALNAASSLNRILKSQAASGQRADVHVHADGTVHANH